MKFPVAPPRRDNRVARILREFVPAPPAVPFRRPPHPASAQNTQPARATNSLCGRTIRPCQSDSRLPPHPASAQNTQPARSTKSRCCRIILPCQSDRRLPPQSERRRAVLRAISPLAVRTCELPVGPVWLSNIPASNKLDEFVRRGRDRWWSANRACPLFRKGVAVRRDLPSAPAH